MTSVNRHCVTLFRSVFRHCQRHLNNGTYWGTQSWREFHVATPVAAYDLRKVELTPLEQRKLTFDSHAMVIELESNGFEKRQAEIIVAALVTLATANMDIVYKDMVTGAHQVPHTHTRYHTQTQHTRYHTHHTHSSPVTTLKANQLRQSQQPRYHTHHTHSGPVTTPVTTHHTRYHTHSSPLTTITPHTPGTTLKANQVPQSQQPRYHTHHTHSSPGTTGTHTTPVTTLTATEVPCTPHSQQPSYHTQSKPVTTITAAKVPHTPHSQRPSYHTSYHTPHQVPHTQHTRRLRCSRSWLTWTPSGKTW
ncbi:coiled-coil domain-containing protein 90B, mitochondrial isoform X2 [Oncorhynchus mykiss]|uniref:coiled-coil domain-containing protein 90B, mitochondrial isoform X2 n=1 Tax=Oncorhynchus mykiss TaxID=8022 RepID=UPI0018775AEF|nr:coiled-coil domain-containing protein 90B, mitochondrial isoform X2 [Oncorhynchus mykiss]